VASLAAWFSYQLNKKQTQFSSALVEIERARALREEEQAERDRVAHEAEMAARRHQSLPFLRLQPTSGSRGSDQGWDVDFVAHNDGGAPAIGALLTVEDDSGVRGEAGPYRIEPTVALTITVRLPRDAVITSSGALRAGLTVRLRDRETGVEATFRTN